MGFPIYRSLLVRYFLALLLAGCQPIPNLGSTGPGSTAVAPGTTLPGTTQPGTTTPGTTTDDACPPGVICVDTLPYADDNTTTGAPASLDGYGCAPSTNESGPEVVYRVNVATEGLFVASLSGLPNGVDVDVHLLEEQAANTCIDRGHWDAAALLSPGTYWVVVDSWVDADGQAHDGAYSLDLVQNHADDHATEGLRTPVYQAALRAFDRAWSDGETDRLEYAVIDYSLPSATPRFFGVDLRSGHMIFRELTSHGSGSQDPNDLQMAADLSNVDGSHASSMGLVRAAETYTGSKGYSMRLDGLEPGYNDNDRSRAIVVHGADYATQDFVNSYGYLGRSWGCPATDPTVNASVIDTLSDGALILKYADNADWLANSYFVAP